MAKVIDPLHSIEARGSVSTLTYNTWRGMHTVKRRQGPYVPYTPKRADIMSWAGGLSSNWRLLTEDQRSAWRSYSQAHPELDWSGHKKRLTGLNWYVRCGIRAYICMESPSDTPPPYEIDRDIYDVNVTWSVDQYVFEWESDWQSYPDTTYVMIYATAGISAGRMDSIHDALWQTTTEMGTAWLGLGITQAPARTFFLRGCTKHGAVGPWHAVRVLAP